MKKDKAEGSVFAEKIGSFIKKLDKDFWRAEYERYGRKAAVLCAAVAVAAAAYSAEQGGQPEVLPGSGTEAADGRGDGENAAGPRILYSAAGGKKELRNPFSFSHEAEAENQNAEGKNKAEVKAEVKAESAAEYESSAKAAEETDGGAESRKSGAKKYELTAVLDADGHKTAVIKISGRNFRAHEGDSVDGAVVESIGRNSAVLREGKDSIVCALKGF